MKTIIFETYNNDVMTHGFHMHKIATDTAMETMCPFLSDKYMTTHWKYVLHCCYKCPIIVIPIQE